MNKWVNVDDKSFPDDDGVLVCWTGNTYVSFYYRKEWTVKLPNGTQYWYLVPPVRNEV